MKILVIALTLALVACETADQNSIETAQTCLNNAAGMAVNNPAAGAQQAYGCEATIANMSSTQAGLIGVGLILIEEQKLANMTSVENAISNGNGAVATSISYLTLSSTGQVNKLVNYATMSGSNGCLELANIINFAAYVNAEVGGTIDSTTTPTAVAAAVSSIASSGNTALINSAASAAVSAQQSACAGSGSSSSLCSDMTKAIGASTDPTTILNSIAAYITAGG